jgi:hypothetical protein
MIASVASISLHEIACSNRNAQDDREAVHRDAHDPPLMSWLAVLDVVISRGTMLPVRSFA